MAIDPVKIPTDIQVEEKIVGPIGLRQIFILMITGGMSYALWSLIGAHPTSGSIIKILCWTPLILGAAFSFVKIHDVTLLRLLLLQIEKLQKPMVRTFGPRSGITINIKIDSTRQEKSKSIKEDAKDKQLEELSTVLDAGHDTLTETTDSQGESQNKPPVNQERIVVSPKNNNAQTIDDIAPVQEKITPATGGIIRDITPLV